MWFSRVWIVLLAAAASLAFGTALVVPKPAARELADAHAYKLDLVQHSTQLLLRLDARRLIDWVSELTRDSRLIEVLERAGARQKGIKRLNARANSVMLNLLSQIKRDVRPTLFIAVDHRGKQIARIGPGDDKLRPGRDGLAGFPLVESALRGYMRDGSWDLDGRLYLMAAAPVISRSRTRYAGALILGREIDSGYTHQLKSRLVAKDVPFLAQTDLAVFMRGKRLAATSSTKQVSKLPLRYSKRRGQILKYGRSGAFSFGKKGNIVVLAPFKGAAAEHDAFYAIIGPPPAPAGLGTALGKLSSEDVSSGDWLLVGGTFIALVALGLLLLQMEGDGPVLRFVRALQRLAKNDVSRLEDNQFPGRLRTAAKLVNEAIDRQPRSSQGAVASKDISQILGADDSYTRPDLRVAPGGGVMVAPTSDDDAPPVLGASASPPAAPISSIPLAGSGAPAVAPEDAPTDIEQRVPRAVQNEQPFSPGELPPPDDLGAPTLDTSLQSSGAASLPMLDVAEELQVPHLASPPAPSADSQLQNTMMSSGTGGLAFAGAEPSSEEASSGNDKEDPLEAYFAEVFREFLMIKRSCGESTDSITYDRFAQKIRKNRQALIDRYHCKDVRFKVYIKDGKAALKATPVKE